MAVFKCKMCGGELTIVEGESVCECEYCGAKQTVSTAVDNEKILKLYDRANRLRMANEFDKAFSIYESIVEESDTEAEAYWGLVLCKYGIEYVDDPATGTKIPTCHRVSFDSVMKDSDFDLVMENSDALAQSVYREQAKQIEEIRKGIVEISANENPYDIFICYKESDEEGNRTVDSVLAQDVYDSLTAKGYKVFFSRISLEDKIGQEYEPYIFAALNSAKVMLAFGTKYEYYNAVWVKNEWSRYLKLMAKDKEKYLIPCFKDIDAYDMPDEFKHLQAQDMGKVGAIQDLLRGIEKIIRSSEDLSTESKKQNNPTANVVLFEQKKRMFLDNEDYVKLEEVAKEILYLKPDYKEGYIAIVLASSKVNDIEKLHSSKYNFPKDKNYQMLYSLSDDKEKQMLDYEASVWKKKHYKKTAIIASTVVAIIVVVCVAAFIINDKLREKSYNEQFALSQQFLEQGQYEDALNALQYREMFEQREPQYIQYIDACKKLEAEDYEGAKTDFTALGDYKDSVSQNNVCQTMMDINKIRELMNSNEWSDVYTKIFELQDEEKKQQLYNELADFFMEYVKEENKYSYFNFMYFVKLERQKVDIETYLNQFVDYFDSNCEELYRSGSEFWNPILTERIYKKLKTKTRLYCMLDACRDSTYYYYDVSDNDWKIMYDNIDNADVQEIVLKRGDILPRFLEGNWVNGSNYFKMDENGHVSYNIPWINYGDYYHLQDGVMWLYKENERPTDGKQQFRFTILSKNSIQIYAYKNGQTFTLTRN